MYIVCLSVHTYVYMCTMCMKTSGEARSGCPGIGVTGGCESPNLGAENLT